MPYDPQGARTGFSITPSDSADLSVEAEVIYCEVGGDINVTLASMTSGNSIAIPITAGVPHPLHCKRVWATGTTATGIKGLTI